MSESIGTARLDIAVDLSNMLASIQQAKNSFTGLSAETQASIQASNESVKGIIATLIRYMETINKSQDEVKLMRGVWKGVGVDVANEIASMISARRQVQAFDLAAKAAAENDALREQQRVVAALTSQFHALEAAEQQAADFALAAKKADENNFLREQQRVVAALTQQFHALEAAEAEAARGGNFVAQLRSQAAAIGKTRAELLEMQAAELGVTRQAAPFIAALKAQEAQLHRTGVSFNEYGISAKQTQLALRQVPAQITDIMVSLQGGQNPLTVLLQQGGQLRDLFGGIRPAAAALANGLRALINPYTLLAAAIAGVVYAYYKMEEQEESVTRSLIMSGRQAEITTDQMLALAKSFDAFDGVTTGKAAEALGIVAANGIIATESIAKITEAAIRMEQATGQSIETTAQQFADLAKDPVGASLKLSESMRYLTRETLDAMQAAIDQGDSARAAALAQEAFADTINSRAAQVRDNLGLISRSFLEIKENSKEAWDGVLDGMRKVEDRADEMLTKFFRTRQENGFGKFAQATGAAVLGFVSHGMIDVPGAEKPEEVKPLAGVGKPVDAKAAADYEALRISNLSKVEQLEREIARIRDLGARSGAKDIEKQVQAAKDRFAESQKKGSTTSLDNAGMREQLQAIKDQLATEQAALQNSRSVLQAEMGAKMVTLEDYYARSKELLTQDVESQERALTEQIAVLRNRNATGKDAIDVQRQLHQVEAELARVRAKAVADGQVLAIQETTALKMRTEAIDGYKRAQDLATRALEDHWAANAERVSMGEQEYAQKQRLADITRKYADEIARLRILQTQDPAKAAEYEAEIKIAEKAMDAQVDATERGYDKMLEAQGKWQNGVKKGWEDWAAQAKDVAGQVAQVTNYSLNRMTDAMVEFALTGKMNWRAMLADILTEIVKFMAKQAVLNFVQLLAGSMGGMGGMGGTTTTTTGTINNGGTYGTYAAQGGVWDSPTLHDKRNTIVSQPTPFYFAKGAGIMGEAGAEAIMPLDRAADGNLGVRIMGMGGAAQVTLTVNTIVNSDGSASSDVKSSGEEVAAYKQFTEQVKTVVNSELQKAMSPGGQLWKVGVAA